MIWIKLHKKLKDWEWFGDVNVTYLWLYLLLSVNDEDRNWKGEIIRRGQMVTSVAKLSTETGLTDKQTRRCIKCLERTSEIAVERASKWSIITICKYDDYQVNDYQGGQAEVTLEDETRGEERATTKEYKILEKERISKDIPKKAEEQELIEKCIETWNTICTTCPSIRPTLFSDKRKASLLMRLKDMRRVGNPLDVFKGVCSKIAASDFIARGNWCTIDWLTHNDENWRKVYNGNFDNKQQPRTESEDVNELWR